MLNSSTQCLGGESDEGGDGGNGELHDCLVSEICRLKGVSKDFCVEPTKSPRIYTIPWR